MLTLPAAWCSLRPIAVTRKQWGVAREELARSVESLFPIQEKDAMIGLVDRAPSALGSDTPASAAYLIAASRRRAAPIIEAVERVLGRPIDMILPQHVALMGLGLQSRAEASVLERLPTGVVVEHTLRWGRIADLARPSATTASASFVSAGMPLAIVDGSGVAHGQSPHDIAVAAALALRVAPESIAPLQGAAPRASRGWIPAAVAATLAIGAVLLASRAETWRYERAVASLEAERVQAQPVVNSVVAERDRAERIASLLASASALMPSGGPDLLDDLAAAQAAIPEGGFMYKIELDERSLTIRGESKRAGDVLRAIEDSPRFHAARELDTAAAVEERALETFHIRAERSPTGSGVAPPTSSSQPLPSPTGGGQ